jgi:hypothetical protein
VLLIASTRDTQRVAGLVAPIGGRLTSAGEEAADDGGSGGFPVDHAAMTAAETPSDQRGGWAFESKIGASGPHRLWDQA